MATWASEAQRCWSAVSELLDPDIALGIGERLRRPLYAPGKLSGARLLPLPGRTFLWCVADYTDFRQKTLKSCWVTDFSGLRS